VKITIDWEEFAPSTGNNIEIIVELGISPMMKERI
jgi:hypothetical protein